MKNFPLQMANIKITFPYSNIYIKASFYIIFTLAAMQMYAQSWVSLGPIGSATYNGTGTLTNGNGTGQIHSIAFHPDFATNNIMFAGTPYGGLWRSNDGGVNWVNVPLVDATGQQLEVNSVNDIVLTKQGTNVTLYVTTGSSTRYTATTPWVPSCGIYKSNNLGATFKPVGTFNSQYGYSYNNLKIATKIAIHPTDTTQIFVACSDGLAKSTNAGATWSIVLTDGDEGEPTFIGTNSTDYNSPNTPGIWSVAYSPTNFNTIYASGRNVYKSTSSGNSGTFNVLSNPHYENRIINIGGVNLHRNMNIKVTNGDIGDLIYCTAFIKNTTGIGYEIYRSSSGGQTPWTNITTGNSFTTTLATEDRLKIDCRPGVNSYVITGIVRLNRSTNSGLNWSQLGNGQYHDDIHEVKFNPQGTEVFLGTDGGIWRYNPITDVLTESNFGLSVSTIFDMSTSPTKKGYLASGKQDTNYDFYNGINWTQLGTRGDGYAPTWFDRKETDKFFYKINSAFYKHDVSINVSSTQLNVGCLTTDPNNPNDPLGTDIDQIFQYPLFPNQNHFWAKKGGNGKIYFSNAASHSTDYKLVDDLAIYSIGKIYIPTHNPTSMYVTPNCPAFWNEPSRVYKLYTNTYNPTNCSTVTCNAAGGLCKDFIKYFPNEIGQNYFPATSIAVSSFNPNKMWVSLSYDRRWFNTVSYLAHISNNQSQGWGQNTRFQLRKTTDNGITWIGDSLGLPQYPIRHLVYVDGSNDAMFCATANGRIFYKNATLAQWQEVNPNLPRSPISKLEINYCTKRLYVATFGRGVYYVDLNSIPAHTNQALQITTDQDWTSNYYDIGGDIVIKAGKTLKITGNQNAVVVNMSKDSKIIVERGARLIADGVTFTNSCGEMWQGIHVWGDNTKPQILIDLLNQSTYTGDQGVCFLTNSKLEYMSSGIRMGNATFNSAFNGGQLFVGQVQFINNNMSIMFLPYNPPYAPDNTQAYVKSKIMLCNFDNEIIPSVQLYQHVLLSGVKGVSIEGNYFKNSLNTTTYPLATSRGYGIYSTDATFIALQYNNIVTENNKFEGLTYGIAAQFTGAMSYPYGVLVGCKVNKAEFVGNRYGIYITGGSVFHKITENTFEVPSILNVKSYGLYLEGTQAYKVQENSLVATGNIGSTYETYGILVSNGNSVDESIRKNTLTNFRYALNAVGQNSNQSTTNNTGLQFLCNTLNNSQQFDIWVSEKTVGSTTTQGSVRWNQGDCFSASSSANNQFYEQNTSIPLRQLARNTNTLEYRYNFIGLVNPYYPPRGQAFPLNIPRINCNPTLPNTPIFSTICPNQIEPNDYQPALLNQWNGEINAMRQLIDDGNTTALKQELQQASPYSIEGVYDELLDKEAISTDVLATAIENPYAEYGLEKLKELIIKNSGLRDTTIEILLTRQLPYSSTDITEMELAQQKQSPEDEINSAIAAKISRIEENMVAWSEQYNDQNKPDSAKLMLSLYDNQSALTRLSLAELQWGLYDEASASAKKVGDKKLEEYIELAKVNAQNGGNWKTMDSSTVSKLWEIYHSSSVASASAKAALGVILDTLIAPYLPSEDVVSFKNENMLANKWQQMKAVNKGTFSVSPNPTSQEFVLSYKAEGISSIEIKIYDQSGKLVDERSLKGVSKSIAWRVDSWQNGVYLIKAIDNKQQRYFAKLNVQH